MKVKIKAIQKKINVWRWLDERVETGIDYYFNCRFLKYRDYPKDEDAWEKIVEDVKNEVHEAVMDEIGFGLDEDD